MTISSNFESQSDADARQDMQERVKVLYVKSKEKGRSISIQGSKNRCKRYDEVDKGRKFSLLRLLDH